MGIMSALAPMPVIFTDVPDNCVAVVNGVRTIHKSEPLDNRFMPISKLKESE